MTETITLTRHDLMNLLVDYECSVYPDGHPLTLIRKEYIQRCFELYTTEKSPESPPGTDNKTNLKEFKHSPPQSKG